MPGDMPPANGTMIDPAPRCRPPAGADRLATPVADDFRRWVNRRWPTRQG